MNAVPLSNERLLWTAACLALALLPSLAELPVWMVIGAAGAGALRVVLAARGRGAPPRAWRLAAAALAVGIVLFQFHTLNGITAGTALLCLMGGLKLLEARTHRDIHVVMLIVYFLCLAALLRGSSFWLLAYLIGVSWLATATLLRLTLAGRGPTWRASFGHSGRILAQAAPLALVLWLLFPRLATPLWHIRDDGGGAVTGLADTMSPGEISNLTLSDEIAFRVRFAGAAPPEAMRYWRGPVLHDFDGSAWHRGSVGSGTPADPPAGSVAYRYVVSLEPHRHHWIFMLDRPVRWDRPRASLTDDGVLVEPEPISRPLDVAATSYVEAPTTGPLRVFSRDRDLRLPAGRNPRTAALALQLRRLHTDDRDYVRAVLAMLHDQEYFYTQSPPRLGGDPVDEFLFDTKRGFCGHYASAFAVLMRKAGIPARIVTGYFGGALNPYADYWIVRQSDAHAWVEVWLAGVGWVRIDPTAAIASTRVEARAREAQGAPELLGIRLPGVLQWLAGLRLRVDAMRELWRERILQFDQNSQAALLARLMIPDPDAGKLAIVLAGCIVPVFLWLTWQTRHELKPKEGDSAARAYQRLCDKLARAGLPRLPHEGAQAYALRVADARPDLGAAVQVLAGAYQELRYGYGGAAGDLKRFTRAVRAFRARRARHAAP